MREVRGIITPIVTPFTCGGSLDSEALKRLVEFQTGSGVHGLFLFGSSGEGPALTDDQRLQALKTVIRVAGGKTAILVGISDNSTLRAIERASQAAEFGADGLVVTPPFYHMNSQAEVADHFRAVREYTDMPIYAYDVPVLVKTKITADTVVKLAAEKVIAGIKDSSGDMSGFRQVILRTRNIEGFTVFTGMELLVDVAMLMGADGAVAGLANVAPREYVELYDLCLAHEWLQAAELQERLVRLFDIAYVGAPDGSFSAGALSGFKAGLVCRGVLDCCTMAAPMRNLTSEGVAKVRELMKDLEFINEEGE